MFKKPELVINTAILKETERDVWTASLDRMRQVYDRFDRVIVSFSGGKEPSTQAGSPAGKGGGRAWEPSPTERVRPNTNGWHDVIDAPLEGKLERLGVFPQIYGQIAEAVRSGEWTVEQVKELADEVLDIGAGPGVFVFRLKNRVRRETQAEKDEKRRNKFVDAYLAQQEARNGA